MKRGIAIKARYYPYKHNELLQWTGNQFTRVTSTSRASGRTRTPACSCRNNWKTSFSSLDTTMTTFIGVLPCPLSLSHSFSSPYHSDRWNRTQLQENALLKKYYCDVDINDLINYNEELAHRLVSEPAEIVPLVRPPTMPPVHTLRLLTRRCIAVRDSPQEMHTPNHLSPRSECHPASTPTPTTLQCRRGLYSKP